MYRSGRLAGWLTVGLCLASAQPPQDFQPYIAESKRYALHKPVSWYVLEEPQADSFRVLVGAPDGASSVEFYWERNPAGRADALEFLSAFRQLMSQTCAEPSFSGAYLSRDSARAMASVACKSGARELTGRFYFESTPRANSAQGYLSTPETMSVRRPVLLNIMASLAFPATPNPATPKPEPLPELIERRAPDGSLSLRTPVNWTFLAGGGKVAAAAPDGAAGFIFTAFSGNPLLPNASLEQGVIGSPYRPPQQTLLMLLQGLGHRNARILSAQPDQETMRECAVTLNRRCEVQDFAARWTSSQGGEAIGAMKLINAHPSPVGLWFVILSGIWGPERDFSRHLPLLEQVAESFSIKDQYARRYIQQGLENLRRLQRQTAAAMQDLNRAREQNQRDWEARQERKDYLESKWDDYRRGNSYWVSELEGGKIYRTDSGGTLDTATGEYYAGKPYNWVNFEGENPRHPSENMRELSSWEVEHGRKPPK